MVLGSASHYEVCVGCWCWHLFSQTQNDRASCTHFTLRSFPSWGITQLEITFRAQVLDVVHRGCIPGVLVTAFSVSLEYTARWWQSSCVLRCVKGIRWRQQAGCFLLHFLSVFQRTRRTGILPSAECPYQMCVSHITLGSCFVCSVCCWCIWHSAQELTSPSPGWAHWPGDTVKFSWWWY